MKIFLLAVISVISLPGIIFAATDDFVAGSDITVSDVTFGGTTADMLVLNGSTAESWTFDSGAFTVSNPGTFKVGSSDSAVKSIQITQGGSTLICAENTTPGTSFATVPTSAGTYTVEPSATVACTDLCDGVANSASLNSFPTCGAASCNAGYKLSGSGGSATCSLIGGGGIFSGSISSISTLSEPRPQIVYPDGTVVYLDEKEDSTSIPVADGTVIPADDVTPTITAPSATTLPALFTQTLRQGMVNDDVTRLQQLLSTDPSIYPEGIVTGYFGQLTRKAVQQFQSKYSVVSSGDEGTTGYGLVGPKTRAKLQEVFGSTAIPAQSVAQPAETAQSVSPVFNTTLLRGMFSEAALQLQQLLNSDPDTQVATEGPGSPSNETTFYGSLTENAVQRFQVKHDIVSSGSPSTTGYGRVGPKTRIKLNEVFGQ